MSGKATAAPPPCPTPRGRGVGILGRPLCHGWSDLSLTGIIGNSELFLFAAAVNGRRAGILLRRELTAQSVERRRQVAGDARRNLVRIIEEMLFRDEASEDAFWCMASLAEAENEQWANNASGILKEVFGPLHPQVPLRLDRRLVVLTEMISPRSSCAIFSTGSRSYWRHDGLLLVHCPSPLFRGNPTGPYPNHDLERCLGLHRQGP